MATHVVLLRDCFFGTFTGHINVVSCEKNVKAQKLKFYEENIYKMLEVGKFEKKRVFYIV